MGQRCDLFDFNFGTLNVNWPGPIKAMVNLGNDLVQCAASGNALEVIKCLGLQLLQVVPPLSFLTKMGDMLTEFIDVFAQVATFVVKQVLSESTTLIQQAAESTFPAVDATPVVHHAGRSLTIKTHSQHRKHSRSKLPGQEDKGGQGGQGMSAVQQDAQRGKRAKRGDDDSDPQGVVALSVSDQSGNYATRLITQWNGKETDTNSCLAFAPKSKTGSNDQATKGDWQGSSADAFIPLEPFGVPCDNDWMKANWDRWQGYSFYTWEMSIEKCVTVTFSLGMQPVIAFVGGLNFELMPAPLAELDTTVCWPDKQPDGVDLSVLQSKIRSGGVMLFSRTLRLQKRFGASTDFVGSNTFGAAEPPRHCRGQPQRRGRPHRGDHVPVSVPPGDEPIQRELEEPEELDHGGAALGDRPRGPLHGGHRLREGLRHQQDLGAPGPGRAEKGQRNEGQEADEHPADRS